MQSVVVKIATHHYIINSTMEVPKLANIKSAKKRILVNAAKAERNKSIKSAIKTYTKKVEAAVAAGDKAAAADALKVASTEIAKACSKGVYHKNNAARKISRLTILVNGMN
jgi:small subunit ribosomal protein S20